MKNKWPFDKYELYQKSVQSPEVDVKFFKKIYEKHIGKKIYSLREDFCGTHAICCEWVKLNSKHLAYGIDLDPDPLIWGYWNNQSQLTQEQKSRIHIQEGNVLVPQVPKAQMVVALNFSYFIFKSRSTLLAYFKNVKKTLLHPGVFVIDVFGGSQCQGPSLDKKKVENFTYEWEQKNYDPLTSEADFSINFKWKSKRYTNVFTYNWRLWSPAELKDILTEAGFKNVSHYWEGTNSKGYGNGVFKEAKKGESCLSWISYLVARD